MATNWRENYRKFVRENYKDVKLSDDSKREDFCRKIERGCYNVSVDYCNSVHVPPFFDNSTFQTKYRAMILRCVSAAKSEELQNKILFDAIKPDDICLLSSKDIWPSAGENEREIIRQRSTQTYEKKVSKQHTCAKCKGNETIYRTYQGRAADESETFSIECINCGHHWTY